MQIAGYDIGRIALTLVLLVALLYLLAGGLLYAFQSKLVYMPHASLEATPADVGIPYQEVLFSASDGVRLSGWYMPLEGARGTVLFCHGNAGNISHLLEVVRGAHTLNLGILLFDYRGYGQSEGTPSEEGTYWDAEAAWDYLVSAAGIDPGRIIVIGRSLGGPIAARLARDNDPAALFLEATFTSLPEVAQEIYPLFPVRSLARIQYPTLEYLRDVQCPVLVTHSRDDQLIPFAHGQRLYQAAGEPKAFTELRGRHVAAFRDQAAIYHARVEDFLVRALGW